MTKTRVTLQSAKQPFKSGHQATLPWSQFSAPAFSAFLVKMPARFFARFWASLTNLETGLKEESGVENGIWVEDTIHWQRSCKESYIATKTQFTFVMVSTVTTAAS
jgi:hypothetical protein